MTLHISLNLISEVSVAPCTCFNVVHVNALLAQPFEGWPAAMEGQPSLQTAELDGRARQQHGRALYAACVRLFELHQGVT